jgi:predicted TIM-barrel fold metal-dependent hydrolase
LAQDAVIDIHHHVGAAPAVGGVARSSGDERSLDADYERRVTFMAEHGIDAAVLFPASGGPAPNGFVDRAAANTQLAAYRDRDPQRFVAALGAVNPNDGELAIDEIDRCVETLGMRGIVWHHRFDGMPMDHAAMDRMLPRLAHHKIPAFVHILADSTLEAPWRLEILADRYPEIQFVALDAFSCTSHAHWMQYIASKHDNICFDTAAMVAVGHGFDGFVEKHGAHRLCLGTNFYTSPRLFAAPAPLNELRALGFAPEDLNQILGGNARRILGLG